MKKFFRIILLCAAAATVAFMAFRHPLARAAVRLAAARLEARSGLHLTVQAVSVRFPVGLELAGVAVVPPSGDTLLAADSVYLRPALLPLFIGQIRMQEIRASRLLLHLVRRDSLSNFLPQHRETRAEPGTGNVTDYGRFIHTWVSRAFRLCPRSARLREVDIVLDIDSTREHLVVPEYDADGDRVSGSIRDVYRKHTWFIAGDVRPGREDFRLQCFPDRPGAAMPLLSAIPGGYCSWDTVTLGFDRHAWQSGVFRGNAYFTADGLRLYHPKLSADTVLLEQLGLQLPFRIGTDYVATDSAARMRFNAIDLQAAVRIVRGAEPRYALDLETGNMAADSFFHSLSNGIFPTLHGVAAEGYLRYRLHFRLAAAAPDALEFSSELQRDHFRLTRFGRNSLLLMNGSFEHTFYENGRAVKTVTVGPGDPSFVPLPEIPDRLKYAILTSEDGNFFFHNGFNADAFRASIAENYKAGRFRRGGSTISMQLVKNVYLTRNKTVARKAEEALLVWLIESNRLVSKERMLEVYLNIVELGPGVYGVKEASHFYFSKEPGELTLAESIFLASLLPRPKAYRYCFDASGNLKPYMADYYRVVSGFMEKKQLITPEDFASLRPEVHLTGPARLALLTDSLPAAAPPPAEGDDEDWPQPDNRSEDGP